MLKPRIMQTFATMKRVTGLVENRPNTFPVSAATAPSAEYVVETPRTYVRDRVKDLARESPDRAPIYPNVIGIMG